MTKQQIIAATQTWLDTFVIAHNICPFARREQENASIRYSVVNGNRIEECLEAVILECEHLDSHPDTETTLLILPQACADFADFLDLLSIAEQLLVDQGYEGEYQLASFHPDYCFAQTPENDPGNFTNRSPYPMLHLIREDSIEKAVASHPDPEGIPDRNIALMQEMGLDRLRAILQACYQPE